MNNTIELISRRIDLSSEKIKIDSRRVTRGDVFIAVKGASRDGHDYISEAFRNGAECVICEREPQGVASEDREKIVVVSDTRSILAEIAQHVFQVPSKDLKVYGVTGTNGKTTTVSLIRGILNDAGRKCGLISTVFNNVSGGGLMSADMTTPGALTINRLMSRMLEDGKDSAAVEISSHALSQKRVEGIQLDACVITNITEEHLDYHGDIDSYLGEKAKIFNMLKPDGMAAINVDDEKLRDLANTMNFDSLITFGINSQADVMAEEIEVSIEGSSFDLVAEGLGRIPVTTDLLGGYNIYNILAAVSILLKSGLSSKEFKNGIENFTHVPGRLEPVNNRSGCRIFIDYAHTPDALENVLRSMKQISPGRLICVFGCGGDRDPAKRAEMGRIASGICDYVVLTNDNPRTEEPLEILREIEEGMSNKNGYCVIESRRSAIERAVEIADAGDVMIIAGKGHEDYQIIGRKSISFSDREVVHEILAPGSGS